MLAKLKAIPVFPSIVIGLVVLLGFYGLSHRQRPSTADYTREQFGPVSQDQAEDRQQTAGALAEQRPTDAELAQQYLAKFKERQGQVQARAKACIEQMQQTANGMAIGAMNGQMPGGGPPCEQYMPQLTAQEAYIETVIYQLQTGDVHSTLQQITGVQVGGQSGSGAASYYRPTSPENDGGIGAVDRYDRQAVRGNSLYTSEDGSERELPTEQYYYRNQNTGQIVPSNQSSAPNDGNTYEQLTPEE